MDKGPWWLWTVSHGGCGLRTMAAMDRGVLNHGIVARVLSQLPIVMKENSICVPVIVEIGLDKSASWFSPVLTCISCQF